MMKIYNHDIQGCTYPQAVGKHLYSGRALGLTEPDDYIQLHPDLQSEWPAITAHYDRIGLTYSHYPMWNIDLEELVKHPIANVSVFYFGDTTQPDSQKSHTFRQFDPDWFNAVTWINSKNNFIQLAQSLNLPIPPTVCLDCKTALSLQTPAIAYPCYIKPAVSVSGAGIHRCETSSQLQQALQTFKPQIPLQIQADANTSTFLNVQYQATSEGCEHFAVSEQILDGCTHVGNRYPTPHTPWNVIDPMAHWIVQQGMRGTFAFDVAVIRNDTTIDYLLIECNPRFNGASYPARIAQKLKIPTWSCETFDTKARSLRDLNLTNLEFDPGRGTGVVLVNWGLVLIGKLAILLAGTLEQQAKLRTSLQDQLT